MYGVYLFMVGQHNSDLGQNIRTINAKYDLNLMDITNQNEIVSGTELYINGYNQTIKGFTITLICLFSLSFNLGILISSLIKKQK